MAARSRLLLPHQTWDKVDFAIAVIGAAFLAYGLWGAATALFAVQDEIALDRDCAQGECSHPGVLVAHQASSFPGSSGVFFIGRGRTYCVLTMNLEAGPRQTAIDGSFCPRLVDGSNLTADIWRGDVVYVRIPAGKIGTFLHPSAGIAIGLTHALGLIPAALFAALIHYDLAHHPVMRRIRRAPPHETVRDS
jgi:hypothetical protein